MWYALNAELTKQYGEFRRYWLDYLAVPVEFGFVFYGLLLMMIRPGALVTPEGVYHLMMGLVLWFLGSMALRDFSMFVMEDASNGTLEQVLLGRYPLWVVFVARSIASFGLWLGLALPVAAVAWFVLPSVDLSPATVRLLPWSGIVVVLLITLLGVYAFGILIGALTMVYKRVTGYADILHYLLLFLTGILYPVHEYPAPLEQVSYLLPLTWGVRALREFVVEQSTLLQLARTGTLWWLLASTAVYLVLAGAGYSWAFRLLLRRGSVRHW